MTKQVRVNIFCNKIGKIRHEKLNGRDVIIVPSATLPDDVVMNGISYPADEIKKSFKTLERTPAPLGHPTINGKFVSASDPEGINIGWIGAFNSNVRQENGRILLDKIIDVERANQSEGGKKVLEAIENGSPVHTSTGLLCKIEEVTNNGETKKIARSMVFDHDAILLDEEGAATPDQGVGMMVNSAGEDIEVINSVLEDADRELDWAVDHLARALERRERIPMLERMKSAVLEAFTPLRETQNDGDTDMADEKQLKELSETVNTLAEQNKNLGTTIAEAVANAVKEAVKPLVEAQEEVRNSQKAAEQAELDGYVKTISAANLLDEETAKTLTLNAARNLAEKAKPGSAAAMNSGTADFSATANTQFRVPGAKKEA